MTAVAFGNAEVEAPQSELKELKDMIMGLRGEFAAAVADVERRLGQARELERSIAFGAARSVHAEDLNIRKHIMDGYLVTANSPASGSIAWSDLHIVFMGVDYTIANGNTANKYAWFIKPGTGTTATLQTGNSMPSLGPNDALIFVNNGGVPISVLESSVSYAVGPGVIGNSQLASDVQQTLANLQAADVAQQARIDGVITSYYQNDPPWPAGSPSPDGGDVNMGDIWYDSNDGGAFRWTGASGTPANQWQRIADTDTSEIAAKVNTKVTTYVGTTAPTAPAGGFTTGDLWIDTSAGNVTKRWSGSAWVTLTIGDAAIASGISGSKIGSGISASNVTTGTLSGALVGSGINGANVGSGISASNVTTGTLAGARVGTGVDASMVTAGTMSGARVGSGISASNVTTGTLSGSLVGTGVSASNVTTGTLSGSLVGTGISATNVTAGTLSGGLVGSGINAANVSTGTMSGARVGTGINGANINQNTVGNTQIAMSAVKPENINAAFHLLY